jgi:nicotinamide mononucleotide adenylyltransferase
VEEQGNARILLQRVRDRLETSSLTMKEHYLALNPDRGNGISVARLKAFVNGFHCGFSDDTLAVMIENKFGVTEDSQMVPFHMFSEVSNRRMS